MKRVHVIGGKNHGKTTLIVDLVQTLTREGLCVGTIKHTHHKHELDTPGKDSHRHRQAGAAAVGICSPSLHAVFWPPDESREEVGKDKYARHAPFFAACDLVLVEGDSQAAAPRVEVWRRDVSPQPMASTMEGIVAVISDDRPDGELAIPVWPRSDLDAIAQGIRALFS